MTLHIEMAFVITMDTSLYMQIGNDGYTMRQRVGEIDVPPFSRNGP
jgi:hypothetical protein